MKKVLIISYYWPPSGGAGVQRWLKFVKYLRRYNWEPIVYTPENPEAPALDSSLQANVPEGLTLLKTRIWEPYTFYKKFTGRKQDDKIKGGFLSENKAPSVAENLSVWIRGNLFIPDARKFWIKPSIRFLNSWMHDHPVDAIISTGPPHSMHRIAQGLQEQLNIPWLADFRDPWTSIDFYDALKLSSRSDRLHHRMEKEVLTRASEVVVVSRGMRTDFQKIHDRKYVVIPNGYDEDDMPDTQAVTDKMFSIAHIGSMAPTRNPRIFWQALKELISEQEEFASRLEVRLLGQVDYSVREMISHYGLDDYVQFIPYMPHDEVIKFQQQAQLLLLVINQTPNARLVVTGKIFEYMKSGRPIISIGPEDGDAASILRETNTGFTLDYENLSGLKNLLRYRFALFQQGKNHMESQHIENYSRLKLCGNLAGILDEMIKKD